MILYRYLEYLPIKISLLIYQRLKRFLILQRAMNILNRLKREKENILPKILQIKHFNHKKQVIILKIVL